MADHNVDRTGVEGRVTGAGGDERSQVTSIPFPRKKKGTGNPDEAIHLTRTVAGDAREKGTVPFSRGPVRITGARSSPSRSR